MKFKSFTFLILVWVTTVIVVYLLGYKLVYFNTIPDNINLVGWDAVWYKSIFLNGYEYIHMQPCNAGFFPLFSILWWTIGGGGGMAISILNLLIFGTGLWFLIKTYKPSIYETLIIISIPSMFFFYVPYTEALFFLLSSFILIGLKTKNDNMVAASLFLASLTRPSFLFFIPAFVFLFLIEIKKEHFWPLLKKYFLFYAFPTILALILLILIQKIQTDTWLPYFRAQRNVWSRSFRLPTLPFGSLEGKPLLWIEALGFWLGTLVSILVFYAGYNLIILRKSLKLYDRTYLFSICYLMMSFLSIIFFNPVWEIERTLLNGMNRYMFANPFLFIFIWQSSKYFKFKPLHLLYLFLFSFIVWLLLEYYYLHVNELLYFLCITLYLTFFTFSLKIKNNFIYLLLFLLNIIGQTYLFHRFLSEQWVG